MNIDKNIQNKAVIYCRVSTKEQAEEGNSLSSQERNCREYAAKHNYEITRVFIEEGESAKTADRTELQKLLRFCSDKSERVKAIIIYKIDRLSRNTDDYSQLRILLKRYGVEIKSTSEYFENTPAGRFMENIIANVAQFDNDVRTERSVGGMKDAVREGRYVWMAPIGFKNQKVNGKSTIVQGEISSLVKKAFEMMADRTSTVNEIRETLSCYGLPLKKAQFYVMLKNRLYTGWIYKFGEKHKGNFEPIVSEELFERVQRVLRGKRSILLYRRENPDFPLRRFVRHTDGSKLTGAWSKGSTKKYPYYRFINAKKLISKEVLETSFCSFMDRYAFDEDLLNTLKTQVLTDLADHSQKKSGDIEMLITKKQALKDRQNSLINKNLAGIINDTLLKRQLETIDEEIWTIDKVLGKTEEEKINYNTVLEYISIFLKNPSTTWRNAPFETKIKLQWFEFPEGIVLDGKKLRTTKISSIYKLKSTFYGAKSANVPYSKPNYRPLNPANNSSLQIPESIALEEIKKELVGLSEILKPNNKTSDSQPTHKSFLDESLYE